MHQIKCTNSFRKPRLRRNIILAILAWTLTLTIFDGHVRNIVNLVRPELEPLVYFSVVSISLPLCRTTTSTRRSLCLRRWSCRRTCCASTCSTCWAGGGRPPPPSHSHPHSCWPAPSRLTAPQVHTISTKVVLMFADTTLVNCVANGNIP